MNEFVTVDVVNDNFSFLTLLFGVKLKSSTCARSVRASEITSFESVPAYEHHGRPNCRLTLKGGETIYVKQHATTIAEHLGRTPASQSGI